MITGHKRHNIIPLIGLAVLILFFAVFRSLNMSIENQLKAQMHAEKEGLSTEEPSPKDSSPVIPQEQAKQKRALRSSDPAQYHILAQKKSVLLESQLYWDSTMRKTLRQSDTINRMSQGNAFKETRTTPEQFQKKLQRIDGRIREYEQRVHNNPGDDYARQKLQDLYMMKSSVSNLEEAVVIHGSTGTPY